jgi:hypothetical protein
MTTEPLDLDELVEHWTLLDGDHELVAGKRGTSRLAFALMLKFYARHGRFARRVTLTSRVTSWSSSPARCRSRRRRCGGTSGLHNAARLRLVTRFLPTTQIQTVGFRAFALGGPIRAGTSAAKRRRLRSSCSAAPFADSPANAAGRSRACNLLPRLVRERSSRQRKPRRTPRA